MFITTNRSPLARRASLAATALLAAAALVPAAAQASSSQKPAFAPEGDNPNGSPAIGQIEVRCEADIECNYAVNPVPGTATTFKDWVPWRFGKQEYKVAAGASRTIDVGVTIYGDTEVEGDETILATVDETRVMRWGKSGISEEADPQVTHTVVVIQNDDRTRCLACGVRAPGEVENIGSTPKPPPTGGGGGGGGGGGTTTPGPDTKAPPVTPPAPDKTAPVASIATRVAKASKKGVVPVTVRCAAGERDGCRIGLTLRGSDGRVVGQAMALLRGGEVRTLPVQLTSRARRQLARKRVLLVNSEVVASDTSGNAATSAVAIRIKSR